MSLTARLNAWVGKYRMQFVRLPSRIRLKSCTFPLRIVEKTNEKDFASAMAGTHGSYLARPPHALPTLLWF
jgi:hypothetical protein